MEVTSSVPRRITARYKARLNAALLRPFVERRERDIGTLYADVHCLTEIFRRCKMSDNAAADYTAPTRDGILRCVEAVVRYWNTLDLEDLDGPVDVTGFPALTDLVPVHDNRGGFLEDAETAELFVSLVFVAAVLHSTRLKYLTACNNVLARLWLRLPRRVPFADLELTDRTYYGRERLPMFCTPSHEVARLYERYLGFQPRVAVCDLVTQGFTLTNNELYRARYAAPVDAPLQVCDVQTSML